MGRKGDALRAMKAENRKITITSGWLKEHDRQMEARFREEAEIKLLDYAKEAAAQYEALTIDNIRKATGEDIYNLISDLLAVSSRVLVERFGWKPVRDDWRTTRLERFAIYIMEEMAKISESNMSLSDYVEETYRLYNVKYKTEE